MIDDNAIVTDDDDEIMIDDNATVTDDDKFEAD